MVSKAYDSSNQIFNTITFGSHDNNPASDSEGALAVLMLTSRLHASSSFSTGL